jgi:tRNA1(Val) A37 N6-methylase TrmN6
VETARALGAYYTPAALAEPLARWAVRKATDTLFDPSCGEGAFLTCAVDRLLELGIQPRALSDQIAGVDLNGQALARARGALLSRHPGLRWSRLAQDDFFLFARNSPLRFDAVLGNPPYLRTQGRPEASKRRALQAARACGAALTADASAWAPFTAVAAGFVKPGGRLAMVVPREALFTNYTKPLLAMLQRRFATVHLVALDELWFEGALVKVALLLAEGTGPGILRFHEARTLAPLEDLLQSAPVAPSWVWSRIPAECRAASMRALASPKLVPFTDVATVSIGVVTGEKDFFLLSGPRARELAIPPEYFLQALSKPSQLAGTTFTAADARALDSSGNACRLLAIPPEYSGGCDPLDAYLSQGVARDLHQNYKCRTRKPWYSVRRILNPPHAFLGYLIKRRLRLAANGARIQSTNNLHRVTFKAPWEKEAGLLAAASMNAATMLSVELLGRIAAAGALKIEPGDASKIRLVRPDALAGVKGAGEQARAIDRALREGRDQDAFALADDLAAKATGWNPRDLEKLRRAQTTLRDVRLTRPVFPAYARACGTRP